MSLFRAMRREVGPSGVIVLIKNRENSMLRMPSFIRRHPRLSILVVAILASVAVWWVLGRNSDTVTHAYTITKATTGNLEETVTAQGKLEPKQYVNVGAQVSGQLLKLHVDVGQHVSASQLVAEIDPRVYESRLEESTAQVRSLKAQLAEQQAQLDLAKIQHGRNEQLVVEQAISKDAFDTSAAALKAADARIISLKAQIEQSESTLAEAKTNLSYTRIYAPMAGTVVSQTAREGQTLNANQTAPSVIEIADLSTMTVRAQVAEADIGKIVLGMDVNFTTLGGQKPWQTKVQQIIPAPEIVNDVVLYNVLADVENADGTLMSGMSTQTNFVVGSAHDAVLIPAAALGKKIMANTDSSASKGEMYEIWVPDAKGEMVSKTVRIGLMNRSMAEVLEGLKAGDDVAIPTSAASGTGSGTSGGRRNMGPRL